ncbi:MAG: FdtA/QdtA family cupin domain-containing protein [bacterium]|nr:FdtA/QdtA family cupin domain-containing protein [bacterium]
MKEIQKVLLKTFTNRGFNLTPVELAEVVPFEVKRIYFFDDMKPEDETGQHCHKIEEEFFIQMKGTSSAFIDQGNGVEEFPLKAGEALYVPSYIWHGFKNASPDSLVTALSSTNYSPDRSDYIEDYEEFVKASAEYLAQQ